MSEATPHKSHAGRWIIGIVLALVLYVGSATPVCLSFHSPKLSWLPPSWEGAFQAFYAPANWLWNLSYLGNFYHEWVNLWRRILGFPY